MCRYFKRMNLKHIETIARELNVKASQVGATAQLIAEGGTVPFIARYRKEVTGSLDEVAITGIRDGMLRLAPGASFTARWGIEPA